MPDEWRLKVEIAPVNKPDIRITLSWDEAIELRSTLGRTAGCMDLYQGLCSVIGEEDD